MPEIKLLNIDCMEFMATCKDKKFDLAIVDPIYGHDITGGHSGENGWRSKEHWGKASEGWNTIKTGGAFLKNYLEFQKIKYVGVEIILSNTYIQVKDG